MAVPLAVLYLQRQKWTGGIYPPLAGIRVKSHLYNTLKRKRCNICTLWFKP